MNIRIATKKDLKDINEIFNLSIPSRTSTARTEPVSMKERRVWFMKHPIDRYPVYVAEIDNRVIGWVAFADYRPGRSALKHTAEVSYYVHPEYQNIGVGSKLIKYVISVAPEFNFKTLIAILMTHNTNSIKLLKKFGFEEWGRMPDTIEMDGKTYSHTYYGKKVTGSSTSN